MSNQEGQGGRRLEAVIKTLDVIEALWEAEGAGVTELTELTGLPKSTVHAHLSTLLSKGYVIQEDGEYRLSLRFLSFGEHVKQAEPLYNAARSPVDDLAERTGERVVCATHQNGLGTMLCIGEGSRSLSTDITIGTHIYLHCSAAGKAMLAFFDEEDAVRAIDRWGLPEFTDETITDRDELFAQLAEIRERGIAYNEDEYINGVYAVGAPIMVDDTVYGGLAVSGPTRRINSEWEHEELRDRLLATTNTIEVNLMFG